MSQLSNLGARAESRVLPSGAYLRCRERVNTWGCRNGSSGGSCMMADCRWSS
jgi:hypothetical protein